MRMPMCMLEQIVGDSQALDRALAGEELSYKDGLELMDIKIYIYSVLLPILLEKN